MNISLNIHWKDDVNYERYRLRKILVKGIYVDERLIVNKKRKRYVELRMRPKEIRWNRERDRFRIVVE